MNGLILLPEVSDDVAHAAQWYDEEGGQGLGDRFVACFYAYLPQIERQGEVHRKVYKDFRRTILKPFPYALYYRHHSGQDRRVVGDSYCPQTEFCPKTFKRKGIKGANRIETSPPHGKMQLCDLRVYTARRKEEKKLAKKGSRRGQFRAKKGSVPSI